MHKNSFFIKIPLLAVAVFLFSAQTIKLQSVIPLPENSEEAGEAGIKESTYSLSGTDNVMPGDSSISGVPVKQSTSTSAFKKLMAEPEPEEPYAAEYKPKKNGKSLKSIVPMREGEVKTLIPDPLVQKKKTSLKDLEPMEQETDYMQPQEQSPYKKDSYSRKKTVHLKNFNPLEEKEEKPQTDWQLKTLPHFKIYYEKGAGGLAANLSMQLENIYARMRLTVDVFPNWIGTEPAKIYLYASHEAYLQGEFHPDKWSQGIAFPSMKTVVLYPIGDPLKLRAVCTHELTHVYFRSFFSEITGTKPPLWLDEGLAVSMESLVYGNKSEWEIALQNYPEDKFFELPGFFYSDLSSVSDDLISYWYLQSYTIVSFLRSSGNKLAFKDFCARIRAGENVVNLLWSVYRFQGIMDFQKKLSAWIAMKSGRGPGDDMFSDFGTGRAEERRMKTGPVSGFRPDFFKKNSKPGFHR